MAGDGIAVEVFVGNGTVLEKQRRRQVSSAGIAAEIA
ncbi:hypothetical protein PAERUG_P44_Wales_1_VIM_2_11_12_01014 [Pseudomonas aeruginosa]|nr:hypothetical protein PAERUG_P31_Wales_1_VIM_2_11_11_00839 [Pseudomonas aeruginosa]CRQ38757.1 hypothetical protein PAERUG_P44_Wales_1_VIM_2_11_12_01014 [Pseudomonas aeruginosa]